MQLTDITWPELQALDKDTPVVIPVAALEQHGHHLPLFTDSLLLGELVRRAASRLESEVLFAPLQWLGHSEHHLDFPGTLSAPSRLYVELLVAVMNNVIAHGFRRLLLLNGHGGNIVPGQMAITEVRHAHATRRDLLLWMATYWHLAPAKELDQLGTSQKAMGHACEWETSMILHLRPDLVGPLEDLPPVPQEDAWDPAIRAWRTLDRSSTGHIGQPALATAAKGQALLDLFGESLITFLRRIRTGTTDRSGLP